MKFSAKPASGFDPLVIGYYLKWFRDIASEPEALRMWHQNMNHAPDLYMAVHAEMTFAEKTALKAACRG